jgi:hypothetical protein
MLIERFSSVVRVLCAGVVLFSMPGAAALSHRLAHLWIADHTHAHGGIVHTHRHDDAKGNHHEVSAFPIQDSIQASAIIVPPRPASFSQPVLIQITLYDAPLNVSVPTIATGPPPVSRKLVFLSNHLDKAPPLV